MSVQKDSHGAIELEHVEENQPHPSVSGPECIKGEGPGYTVEEERRVRWKIDLRLVPVMLVVNGMQFVDKMTIAYAATYGIIQEAHLVGQEFSLLITIFYLGYLVAQYPTNWLMQRFPTGQYLTVNFILWGIVLAVTGSATNFHTLAAARFFLGVFESCLNPGFVLISTSWWTREEQSSRIALWYSANGLASIPAGILFWAIAHIDVDGIFPYQWMFIIFGSLTILLGISLWFLLPDSPSTCHFLTPQERLIATSRLRSNHTGSKTTEHKKDQIIEALTDPRVWMLVFAVFAHNMTNSLQTNFLGIIIKGLGYNTYQSVLLQMPSNVIMAAWMIAVGFFLSSRWGEGKRIAAIIICYIPGLIACCILYAVPDVHNTIPARLAAVFLVSIVASAGGLMYGLLAANVGGYTKKTVTGALYFSAYCVANIVSPQTFIAAEAPRYRTGIVVALTAFCVNIGLFAGLYVLYKRENGRRDREGEGTQDEDDALVDLSDRQNKLMRYKL